MFNTELVTPPVSQDEPETAPKVIPRRKRQGALRGMMPSMSIKLGIGLFLVFGVLLFGFIAPLFAGNPRDYTGEMWAPPSATNWLGTGNMGADVFSQLAHGANGSLLVGLTAGVIAITLSLIFGIVAGYVGGFTDEFLSLITNIMLVIPGLPLIIVIAAFMESRSMWVIAAILGLTSWAGSAIVLRLQAKSLRNRDYVAASRVAGEKTFRIILVEILPNLLPLLAAQFLGAVLLAILSEAGLSFLGLGPDGAFTWGTILNQASQANALARGAWWWFVPPGLMIALFGAGLSLINFSIDETINPKLRSAPDAVKRVRKAEKEARKNRGAVAPTGQN